MAKPCKACTSTDRKIHGQGLCTRCYQRARALANPSVRHPREYGVELVIARNLPATRVAGAVLAMGEVTAEGRVWKPTMRRAPVEGAVPDAGISLMWTWDYQATHEEDERIKAMLATEIHAAVSLIDPDGRMQPVHGAGTIDDPVLITDG